LKGQPWPVAANAGRELQRQQLVGNDLLAPTHEAFGYRFTRGQRAHQFFEFFL